ncbi:hypothetical protein [Parasphingorhabdus cellanae]|uniref:Cupin 2 conserved barrel domain-containing protein n=1 Tax=Parasphingorhabdus cellanae TaxID=2806553 RepID=A0ABX7T777_9SPHN|nr:hypothetical protein [Parasphingorhabdus cellanae]QTD57459.1 hypothetical protein J4G78_08015 [Parasphingorhabdus cellanae]
MPKHLLLLPVITCLLSCSPSTGKAGSIAEKPSIVEATVQERLMPMTIMPVADALDRPFRPLYARSPDGPQIAVLDGNPDSGPSFTLFRYGRDYKGSGNLHFHTHDYHLWLIEGELKHWDAEGNEDTAPVLRPGSYVHQPGQRLHAANCVADRCTAYVIFDGPIETGFPENR